ncbi:MAG: SLC26A/SulP transporter family protein [Spirochaetes bacterium]|nr:SLC26A/SulP transporter family protein [Spirochaetota bacterium]
MAALPGDLRGGFVAAIITIPTSIAYGVLVFSVLGPEYRGLGAVAGLTGLVFLNLASAILGRSEFLQSGPIALAALMLASSAAVVKALPIDGAQAPLVLFFIVFLAGVFQILLGFLKLGNLIQFIPYPVVSGLINGTLVTIILSEYHAMFGLPSGLTLLELPHRFGEIQPLTALTAASVIAVFLFGRKWKGVPASLAALAVGILVYHLLDAAARQGVFAALPFSRQMGPLLGELPPVSLVPRSGLAFAGLVQSAAFPTVALRIIPLALSLALVASLYSLLSLVSVQGLFARRPDANRELTAQGLGNLASAFFGGIAGAALYPRTRSAWQAGARSGFARVFSGLSVLALVLLAGKYLALVPEVVISAFLVVFCLTTFDAWSLGLVRGLGKRSPLGRRRDLIDLSVMLLVAGVLVMAGIFPAVVAGLLLSMLVFVMDSGRDILRGDYTADRLRSNVERRAEDLRLLAARGRAIRIADLDGSLFFATADKVRRFAETVLDSDAEFLILNFKRVKSLDATGAQILRHLGAGFSARGKRLLLAFLSKEHEGHFHGGDAGIFPDFQQALAWAEDRLLERGKPAAAEEELPLSKVDALSRFRPRELAVLARFLQRKRYPAGTRIFREGKPGDRAYFLTLGRADVYIDFHGGELSDKRSTICAGTTFGEMSIIDAAPRSASVVAATDVVCFALSRRGLARLRAGHPALALKLTEGIAREISKRLRIVHGILSEIQR